MREIIPSQLWIGNAGDVRDQRRLHETGIFAIVDLAFEESHPPLARELIYCRIPLTDGSGNAPELVAAAIEAAASLIRKEIPTLVACSAGMSRSPSIAAAALAIVCKQPPSEVLEELTAKGPHDISPAFWRDVVDAYDRIVC